MRTGTSKSSHPGFAGIGASALMHRLSFTERHINNSPQENIRQLLRDVVQQVDPLDLPPAESVPELLCKSYYVPICIVKRS